MKVLRWKSYAQRSPWVVLAALLTALPYDSSAQESSPAAAQAATEAPAEQGPLGEDVVRLRFGERATVERLPRPNGRIVEMYARNVDEGVDVRALFQGNTAQIASMDAVERGGGVWLLRAALRPGPNGKPMDLAIEREGADVLFRVVPGSAPPARGRESAPTLDQLISGELPPVAPVVEPASIFRVLPGDSISQRMESWEYDFALTRTPKGVLQATSENLDAARRRMLTARPGTSIHQEYLYYLGYYYLARGFGREARYYFAHISARPGNIPQREIALERARAELQCNNLDEARQWYKEAYALGADHDSVLEGLALISLQTGIPARAPTGRLLWASTRESGPLMLAAELLQMDGRVAESRDILEAVKPEMLSDGQRSRYYLRLGDARFYDRYEGNVEQAAVMWSSASPELARARDLFLELHQTGSDPRAWAELIPGLVQTSMQRSDAGAEALYLLSQVDGAIGSREDAINDLALILRRYPQKASGSDVPERFWNVYSDYVTDLAASKRWFDIAALHEAVWSPTVRRAVQSPASLVDVARAFEEVGLPERAVVALRDAVQVLFETGADDAELVYHLAELYAQVGEGAERLPDAPAEPHDPTAEVGEAGQVVPFGTPGDEVWKAGLDTLVYLRQMDQQAIPAAKVDLLEARLLAGKNDLPGASAALRRAATDPAFRDDAQLKLALIDANNDECARAVPVLRRLASVEGEPSQMNESRPWLALARCLVASGDSAGAASAARQAAEIAASRIARLDEEDAADRAQLARVLPEVARGELGAGAARSGIAVVANERADALRGEVRTLLEAELQYAVGLAAVAANWSDRELIEQLQERGGVWSNMAEDYQRDAEFEAELATRQQIPWNR